MKRFAFALLLLVLTALSVGRADSIWDRRDPRYGYLFQDTRARNIGDALTVAISESTVANEQDQRTLSRTTSGSGSVQLFSPLTTAASTGAAATAGTAGNTLIQFPTQTTALSFAGNAQNTTNHVFTDTMGVVVVDILPNGNLVVEGYRSRVVEGEERMLRLTGIVRQADIGVGNVVPSNNIANFRITYLGRGYTTNTTRPGLLTRLAGALRLF
ncbi:flagellar basal body L-ring protein FlgH [Frigoriglobus tundricola]|uniref:Flagellar L-ring protein FlgH n=1 Tax=Frigoriglobus tundricola TaxID=2774151 RepID=A0A6M5YVM6_9BACT|nr:flagellar basal body L-ring protein FlgH [Frigoriglobus tundricola]QJW97999.1 Flagellar L-ring protein FlgH [Frigoriglobus tundricola]